MQKKDHRHLIDIKPKFSSLFQICVIILCSVFFISSLVLTRSSGIFLDYLYILCISLAGFWFGLRGGILIATFSIIIFSLITNTFGNFVHIDSTTRVVFSRFALFIFAGISFGYLSDKEKYLKLKLRTLAQSDELTGCYNYRYTMATLEREMDRSRRYNKVLTIAMLDIDYFKNLNDTYGHLVGNEILKNIGTLIKTNLRNVDVVGRYGGDEFLIIFPEISPEQALCALKRVSGKLLNSKIYSSHLKYDIEMPMQFSAGIASFPRNGNDLEALMNMVDYAVYKSKKTGRGKIIIEKRKWKRLTPKENLGMEIKLSNNTIIKVKEILDVSQKGAKVTLDYEIDDAEFLIKIIFPDKESSSYIQSQQKYKLQISSNLWHVGIHFFDLPKEVFQKMTEQIKHSNMIIGD